MEELKEKRCLSFQHCARQAAAYYGTPSGSKALCASWAESFCFGNELIDEDVRNHHLLAQSSVNGNQKVKAQCREITVELSKCMRNKHQ